VRRGARRGKRKRGATMRKAEYAPRRLRLRLLRLRRLRHPRRPGVKAVLND
jgi:hypothetical protein